MQDRYEYTNGFTLVTIVFFLTYPFLTASMVRNALRHNFVEELPQMVFACKRPASITKSVCL